MVKFIKTAESITNGVKSGIFPGAVFSTGDKNGEIFRISDGYRSLYPEKEDMTEDTLFDMASVSKIMSTTMIALKLIESGELNLSDKISLFFDVPFDKRNIEIRHLMTHTSGLPAYIQLEDIIKDPAETCRVILESELLYAPGAEVTYSCIGYILLGKICEKLREKDLSQLAQKMVFEPLNLTNATYKPDASKFKIAKTEYYSVYDTWLHGIVHDDNARFLKGISGNAGVFANISDCSAFAVMLANKGTIGKTEFINRDLFAESIKNYTNGLSEDRGLGFVVKGSKPTSAGTVFSDGSYGHTGFTGTSVWVDKETTQYAVLLTNRVHPTRDNRMIIEFRKHIHDICAAEYRS